MSKSNSTQTKGNDPFVMFAENLFKLIFQGGFITIQGFYALLKLLPEKPIPILSSAAIWWTVSFYAGEELYHLQFLHWIWPDLFSGWILRWCLSFSRGAHMLFLFFWGMAGVSFVFGLKEHRKKTQLKRRFEAIGLTDHFGWVPKLIATKRIDEYREKMIFRADAIGVDRFESKRSALEGILQKKISSISQGTNPAYVELTFNTRDLPRHVSVQALEASQSLSVESFYVGETVEGVLQQKITHLPHLMIAGTTGGGKSVFFKQVLYGLLKSSPHLQMYLIDLKGGLEFTDFKAAPNVRVVKTAEEAVVLLEAIEREMNARFKYLEEIGHREVSPFIDDKDRIVVAIDEASVLYAKRSSQDADYELVNRAREVTDSLAKLGRAAGIHLILATQKVSKETVETTIQENISARMCFRMNTLHGSLAVLGSKEALDIPSIPGRAIWLNGHKRIEAQAPSIVPGEIQAYSAALKEQFEEGSRSLFGEMIGTAKPNPCLKNLLRLKSAGTEESHMNG